MIKFIKRIGNYWWTIPVLILTIGLNVFMDCLIPIQLGVVISDLSDATKEIMDIFVDSAWILFLSALSGIAAIVTCKISSIITAHIVSVSRYQLFKRVSQFTMKEMNNFSVSSLVTRTTNDLTFVGNTLNLFFRYILYGPVVAIGALVCLLSQGIWQMTFAVIVGLVVMLIVIILTIIIVLPKYVIIQQKLDKVTLVSRENLEGLRVVRAYQAESYQEEKFGRVNTELMKTTRFSNRGLNLLVPAIQVIMGIVNIAIYVIGSKLVRDSKLVNGSFHFADITIVVQFAALMLVGFVMLILVVVQLPRAIVCMKRVNEVIDTVPSIEGAAKTPETTEVGTIEFKDVSFVYPGAEKPVLSHISFKVKKGETIAFIGATGSGKTTLINLLPRLFDATEGEVLVDGINVKEYATEDLNAKFGYVPQKGYLFHDTLLNNVTLGKPDATPFQVNRALEISQSSEFVKGLPNEIQYEISQGGKNVSGGQRQRLCIARAIIMDPEIFIFDDSFSALDYRTDKILRGEIRKQCAGVTNVIVAQRVGTIMDADKIIVLENGEAVGVGTHKELLKTCPIYHEIALSQLSEEELSK